MFPRDCGDAALLPRAKLDAAISGIFSVKKVSWRYSGLGRITFFQAFGLKVLLGLTVGKVTLENKRKKENGAM